jgi:very-short-patch-repair endonuclease
VPENELLWKNPQFKGCATLADFYFKAHKLVIELDGSAHDDQKEYDAGRDAWLLRGYGVRTISLSNAQVFQTKEALKLIIIDAVR